jgi:hypothetical protein
MRRRMPWGSGMPNCSVRQREMVRAIAILPKETHFGIVAFDGRVAAWRPKLVPALDHHKQQAIRFVSEIRADGETAWFDALEAAMTMDGNTEAVFFLTDGVPTTGRIVAPAKIAQVLSEENTYRRIKLHTVGIGVSRWPMRFLAALAEDSGGQFRAIGNDYDSQPESITHQPDVFTPQVIFHPARRPLQRMRPFSAAAASRKLRPDELVLGVVVDGTARAYPLNMLTGPDREIINDVLHDVAIAVTWCHLCHHGAVFQRQVGDTTLVFSVSGRLWSDNLVMVDNQSNSAWSEIYGRAMQGPLESTRLERLPSVITEWSDWKRMHPETTSLLMRRTVDDYDRSIYWRLEDYVVATEVRGIAQGWPFSVLERQRVVNGEIDGQPLVVVFDVATHTPFIYQRRVGETDLTFHLHEGQLVDQQTDSDGS